MYQQIRVGYKKCNYDCKEYTSINSKWEKHNMLVTLHIEFEKIKNTYPLPFASELREEKTSTTTL